MSLEQKIKKFLKTGLVIGGCLLGSLVYSNKAEAVEIVEQQITTNTSVQRQPDIYGTKIVWQDNRNVNWDIYMYDLTTGIANQLTTNTSDQRWSAIYQDKIVWQDYRNGNNDIYMYDIITGIETRITTNRADQRSPAISGNKIVWTDGGINIYDITTGIESQIATRTADQIPVLFMFTLD